MQVEIDSLAVDKDRGELFYGYRLIDDTDEVVKEAAFALDGEEYQAAQDAVNRLANSIAQTQADKNEPIALDIFSIIETALEHGASARLGLG